MGKMIFLRLLYTYFRHRWLYLLPIVFLTIAGCYYLVTAKRYYIASGVVYTEQTTMLASLTAVANEGFSWNTPAQNIANQFSDLTRTDAFIRAVIKETDLEAEMDKGETAVETTISEVRKRIWVITAGTNQVQINASNVDPQIAYQLAKSSITTFIQWKMNKDRVDSVTAVKFFTELVKEYRSDVLTAQQALRNYLQSHPEPVRGDRPELEQMEIKDLQADLDFAGKRLAGALDNAENARLAESQLSSNNQQMYTVIDAPELPEKAATSRKQLVLNAAIFVAAGVLLSILAVIGVTVLERSFRIPEDVRVSLGLPVLATIPDMTVHGKTPSSRRKRQQAPEPDATAQPIEGEPVKTLYQVDLPDIAVDIRQEQRVERLSKGKSK